MSDDGELFDDSKYVMDPQEKNEITENIKRKYQRKQPIKPRTEAQKIAFEKARAKLIENKEKRLARKSAPVQQSNNRPIHNKPVYNKPIAQPKKEDPVYDDEYEDLEDAEQFMITDNDKNNYIVRPVKKRTIEPVKKKITKKKIIKDNIDDDRLDNIVETQINDMERSKMKTAQRLPPPKNMNPQSPQHVNVYSHQNVIKQSNQPRQKKFFSALDDF